MDVRRFSGEGVVRGYRVGQRTALVWCRMGVGGAVLRVGLPWGNKKTTTTKKK